MNFIIILIFIVLLVIFIAYMSKFNNEPPAGREGGRGRGGRRGGAAKKVGIMELASRFSEDELILFGGFPDLKHFFPHTRHYQNLQITKEGIYSTTPPKQMKQIMSIIERVLDRDLDDLIVTDATANVGGSAIAFAEKVAHVNAVEINPKTCEVLKNNLEQYKFAEKITILCNDYTEVMKDLKQDIIFIDPPWSGLHYKEQEKINLKLGNLSVGEIVNELYDNARLIVIKIPRNFDREEFEKVIEPSKLRIAYYNVAKYMIVTARK